MNSQQPLLTRSKNKVLCVRDTYLDHANEEPTAVVVVWQQPHHLGHRRNEQGHARGVDQTGQQQQRQQRAGCVWGGRRRGRASTEKVGREQSRQKQGSSSQGSVGGAGSARNFDWWRQMLRAGSWQSELAQTKSCREQEQEQQERQEQEQQQERQA